MATSELEILVKIRNEAEKGIKQLQDQVSGVGKEFLNTKSAIEMAAGALAGFAGYKMLGSFISATREANLQMAQARFFANKLGTEAARNLMPSIVAVGKEMQKLYGISDELASKAYAKMIAKFGEGGKTLTGLHTLLKLHKLGLWDIDSSTTMLMGSTDDMTRALMFLARTLGVEVNPEMDDLWEILDRIRQRQEEINFSELGVQIDRFKEIMGDIKEKAGTPFLEMVNWILGGINQLIERFPILADVIAGAMMIIATSFAGLALGTVLKGILRFFEGILAAAGPWGMAMIFAIGGVIWAFSLLKKSMEKEGYAPTLEGLKKYLVDTFVGIGITLGETWVKVKDFFKETWEGMVIIAKEIWEGLKTWFHENIVSWFEEKLKWIEEQVNRIRSFASEVISTRGVSTMIGGMIGGMVGRVLGTKQMGGYISETGPYLLHRGEYVVPSHLVRAGMGIGGITINIYGNTFMSDEDAAVKIGDMIIKVLQRNIRF